MTQSALLQNRASELRSAFDHSFAAPLPGEPPPQVDLLAIRCEDHGLVLRLSEVRSVHTDRKIVPVPAPRPELCGLVSVRGFVTPVYDLHALLGYEPAVAPRFLALVRAPAPFALAFAQFERHLRVPGSDIVVASNEAAPHPFARASVETDDGPRPIIDLLALFKLVTSSTRTRTVPEREDP
jgi:chemotaxis signal transduction protein